MGSAREGGDTGSARKCTFMELALCLAPGLDANGISILYKSAKPALQVSLQLQSCTSCCLLAVTAPIWCCACTPSVQLEGHVTTVLEHANIVLTFGGEGGGVILSTNAKQEMGCTLLQCWTSCHLATPVRS